MGNAATSCAPLITSNWAVKVLSLTGNLQLYAKPVKAAELMMENPGYFLSEFNTLKVGQRIHGLSADEVLKRRQIYFLLPMELLYSVLTHEEMDSLSSKATKALKHYNLVKIFPLLTSDFCISPSTIDSLMIRRETERGERHTKQRYSWRPSLETIVET